MYSPDKRSIVFVSNRNREHIAATGLWSVSAAGGAIRALSEGTSIDRDPRFSPDGRWLYFSSDRGGSFDLYRAAWTPHHLGPVQKITNDARQNLSPSVSPDGTQLVYMAVDDTGNSRLAIIGVDGSSPSVLTEGPTDLNPSWSQTGHIAFSSMAPGREDAELWVLSPDRKQRRVVVDAPNSDEMGPRWSSDGRYLFAIATYRSAVDKKPVLGSIVFVDTWRETLVLQALHDPASVETRIGFALRPGYLDSEALGRNRVYRDALERVLLEAMIENQQKAERENESKESKQPSE